MKQLLHILFSSFIHGSILLNNINYGVRLQYTLDLARVILANLINVHILCSFLTIKKIKKTKILLLFSPRFSPFSPYLSLSLPPLPT